MGFWSNWFSGRGVRPLVRDDKATVDENDVSAVLNPLGNDDANHLFNLFPMFFRITDVDVGDFQGTVDIINNGRNLSITAGSAYDYLKDGESITVEIGYTTRNWHGGVDSGTVQLTIEGVDDDTIIGGTLTGSVFEDGVLTTSGVLTVSGPDGDEAFVAPASLEGQYGTFTFDAGTGAWSYTLDNDDAALDAIDEGFSLLDTLTIESADGTASEDITVTINGADEDGGGDPGGGGERGDPFTITFEDLTAAPAGSDVPFDYQDFDGWARAILIDGAYENGSGIAPAAAVSGTNVIVNGTGDGFDSISIARDGLFDLVSGYFSAVDGDVLIEAIGFDDDRNPVVTETFLVSGQAQYVEFGDSFAGVEVVDFNPAGNAADLFAIDDLTVALYI